MQGIHFSEGETKPKSCGYVCKRGGWLPYVCQTKEMQQNVLKHRNMYFNKKHWKNISIWAFLRHKVICKLKSSTEERNYPGIVGRNFFLLVFNCQTVCQKVEDMFATIFFYAFLYSFYLLDLTFLNINKFDWGTHFRGQNMFWPIWLACWSYLYPPFREGRGGGC